MQRVLAHFHLHRGFDPQRARDQVALAGNGGLLRRDQAGVQLLLQERMVACELLHAAAAQAVAARVAHMPQHHMRAAEHGCHQRGAHAGPLVLRLGSAVDGAVGGFNAGLQRLGQLLRGQVQRAGQPVHPGGQLGAHAGGGHVGRHFARVVAAHAVGQQGGAVLRVQAGRVFVVGAHPPGVGAAAVFVVHGLP